MATTTNEKMASTNVVVPSEQFVLSHDEAKALLSHSGLTVQDTEAALKEMDLNGDGKYQAVEVGGQIGRLMMKARDQAKVTRACRKTCGIVLGPPLSSYAF